MTHPPNATEARIDQALKVLRTAAPPLASNKESPRE
jgi:hypothetical protein